MSIFCKYKDILGKVGEGVHSIRLFNIAIVDVGLTFIGAYIIYLLLKIWHQDINYWLVLAFAFFSGIVMHRLFCVRTTIDKLLFP